MDETRERHTPERDRAIVAVAGRQHGVVTSAQLRAAGLGPRSVAHRVARGWLSPRHRGVYRVGPIEGRLTRDMAAVLACGPRAILSHRAAAALWEILPADAGDRDVTVPGRRAVSRPGIRVHNVARLDPTERATRHGVPVTSLARTLLDLAPLLAPRDLARALEQGAVLHRLSPEAVRSVLERHGGERGITALRRAASELAEPQLTRSDAEHLLLRLIRAARVPGPRTNARVGRFEVDLLWPEQRLVVEVDGYAYHGGRQAFERDRLRDAELQALGYRVLRITWRQLTREPEAVTARLAAALAVVR